VIVVSEETGRISVAIGGELKYDLTLETLRHTLYQIFNQALPKAEKGTS